MFRVPVACAAFALAAGWLTAPVATASLDVKDIDEHRLGAGELTYTMDPGADRSVQDVRAGTGWRAVDGATPSFGYTPAAVWLRGQLRNSGPTAGTWLLEVGYPNLDEVQLWLVRDGRSDIDASIATGDSHPFAHRPIAHRNFVFAVDIAAGQTVEFLLRVRSTTSVQVPLKVWAPAAFREASNVSTLFHGIFFGIMFVMAIYNLFIYISIREHAYLYYVAFVASFALYQGFHHGFTYAHLWSASPWWHAKSGAVAISLTLGFAGSFANVFLGLRKWSPRAFHAMRILSAVGFGNAALSLVVSHSVSARIASVLALVLAPLVLGSGIGLWRSGMTAARYFVLAWIAFCIGATLFALSKLGVAPYNLLTENALQAGSVAEVMLLSFALGDRINAERRARTQARVDAVRREQEMAALSRYVPTAVSERVLAGDRGALERARRDVVVLCAVPAGFLESLSTLAPERVAAPVNRFVDAMSELARQHGGVVDHLVGPRITVVFGALEDGALDDRCRAAAELAEAMQREVNELVRAWEASDLQALTLRMAVGIAAGNAVVGTFGVDQRLEYAALGRPTVRAHQLASEAIPGEVRLDERTAAALRAHVPVMDGPDIEYAPGVASPSFRLGEDAPTVADATEDVIGLDDTAAAGAANTMPAAASGRGPQLPALPLDSTFDGRYRIVAELGRGGTAVVYRALHVARGEERAIKLLAPAQLRDAYTVEQFRREAKATARIQHPNAVRLHDFGRSIEGHYYMALDCIDGGSLAARIARDGPLAPAVAVDMGVQILGALGAAHALQLVHRDVKPANVLLDGEGRVHVTDFGLVLPLTGDGGEADTFVVGTPRYMSPEQSRGKALDARSDLYSFGVTLYEMLSGRTPYDAEDTDSLLRAIRTTPPVPLAQHRADLPADLWRIIAACLAKSPDDRPARAQDVSAALTATERSVAL